MLLKPDRFLAYTEQFLVKFSLLKEDNLYNTRGFVSKMIFRWNAYFVLTELKAIYILAIILFNPRNE